MKSSSKMIFHCSLPTLEAIFDDQPAARRLCVSKLGRAVIRSTEFTVAEHEKEKMIVEYAQVSGDAATVYTLHFHKVTESAVKCQVEVSFRAWLWLLVIAGSYTAELFIRNEWAGAIGTMTILVMIPFAFIFYRNINKICSRIKSNYENSEEFLKLHENLTHLLAGMEKNGLEKPSPEPAEDEMPVSVPTYYIHDGTEQSGPFYYNEAVEKATTTSYIWKEGMDGWVKAEEMLGFKNKLRTAPPPFTKKQIPPPFIQKNANQLQ